MRNYDIGFFSSPDRGLDCLLDMLPKIEKQLGRKVKAVWAYGWNNYDVMHAKDPAKMKWKWQMIRKMNDVGMESKGRLNHENLARLMKDTHVWAYPTEFTEIHCITALKAQSANMIPITTGVAALETSVIDHGLTVRCDDIYTNKKKQAEFISNVVKAIKEPAYYYGWHLDSIITQKGFKNTEVWYWPEVAKVWDEALA